jgi:hypothetical protein
MGWSMRKNVFAVVVLFLFLALPVIASEQHEHLLPLQGTIQANGGDLGRGDLIITIWDAPTAGNLVYNSTTDFYNVVSAGDYDILLGNGSQPLSLVFGKRYYMDVLINRTDVDFNGSERQLFMSNVGNITMTTPLATNSTDVDSALNISRGGAYINGNVSVNETINITAANGDIVTAGRFTTESTDVDDALNLTAGGLTVAGNIDQAFRVNNTGDVRVRSADTDDALNVSNGAAFLTAGNSGTVNIGRTGWNVDNNGDLSTNSDDANAGGTISVLSREPVVFTVNNGFNMGRSS